MGNVRPQFEQVDLTGSTKHYVGLVGTTAITLSDSGKPIAEVLFNTQPITGNNVTLLYSFDGGVTYSSLKRNTIVGWAPRGPITVIYIKGSAINTEYDVVINYEDEEAV